MIRFNELDHAYDIANAFIAEVRRVGLTPQTAYEASLVAASMIATANLDDMSEAVSQVTDDAQSVVEVMSSATSAARSDSERGSGN